MGKPVVHFEIGCRDSEQTRAFYRQLFDWETEPYGPASHTIRTGSDKGIQGHITSLGHEPHHYTMFYVQVEDIPAHLTKIESLGGRTLIPELPIPGVGHFAWFADPDGNTVGLLKPAP